MAIVNTVYSTTSRTSIDEDDIHRDDHNGWSDKSNEPHIQFFKTRLCPFRVQGCRRGDSCTYAHDEQELRPSLNLTKTKLCYAHIRGKCQNAAGQCRYAHGHNNLRPTPQLCKTQSKNDRIQQADKELRQSVLNRSRSKSDVLDLLNSKSRDVLSLDAIMELNDSVLVNERCNDAMGPGRMDDSMPASDLRHNSQQWSLPSCGSRTTDVGIVNALSSSTTRSMPGIMQSQSTKAGMSHETLRAISSSHSKFDSQEKEVYTPYLQDRPSYMDIDWKGIMNKPLENELVYNNIPYDQSTDGLAALMRFLDSRGISVWEALYILKSLEQPTCRFDGPNSMRIANRPPSNPNDVGYGINW